MNSMTLSHGCLASVCCPDNRGVRILKSR